MLSRVADALYWMSRYVERGEHAARVLEVTRRLLIDLSEVDPDTADLQWNATLEALRLPDVSFEAAVYDDQVPGSVASCISRARENARQVREVISSEMWDYINQAYWSLHESDSRRRRGELISDTLGSVVRASFLWGGVSDATLGRGEGWLFIRLGQFVERTDRTGRIFTSRWRALEADPDAELWRSEEHVVWLALLRSCGSLEEYRKRFPTRIDPRRVVDFVVLDRTFPRTVRYAVSVSADYAKRLSRLTGERGEATERAFGRLSSRLEYATLDEIFKVGPSEFLDSVLEELGQATMALQRNYFLH